MRSVLNHFTRKIHRRWQSSIVIKLAVSIACLIAVSMSILGYTLASNQAEVIRQQIYRNGLSISDLVSAGMTEMVFTDDRFGLQVMNNSLVKNAEILGSAVYNNNGEVYASGGHIPDFTWAELLERTELMEGERRFLNWQIVREDSAEAVVSFISKIQFQNVTAGYVLVTFSMKILDEMIYNLLKNIIATTVLLIVLVSIVAVIMSRRIAHPIKELVRGTERVAEGDLDTIIEHKRLDELGSLTDAFNRMTWEMKKKKQVELVLSNFLDGDVAKEMLNQLDDISIGSKQVNATVLFVDIVGFTSLTEKLPPEEVIEFLNEFFSYTATCSRVFYGSVDKFIGDCAMVLFGVPFENDDHSYNAVACAFVIQKLLIENNRRREREGKCAVQVKIGIDGGEMMAGVMGGQNRMDYTVVGDKVNTASRLCGIGKAEEIIISDSVYHLTANRIKATRNKSVFVKGKQFKVKTWTVESVTFEHPRVITELIHDILEERPVD